MASVALALLHELAEPYPFTDKPRAEALDDIYEALAGPQHNRRQRLAWAIHAGGEVR